MTVLHLGVIDIPYANDGPRKSGRGKKKKLKQSTSMTTHDVATILEDKYSVMEIFFGAHRDQISKLIEEALAGALESQLMGAPASADPFASVNEQIGEMFKQFILTQEIEKIGIPGVPTQAALAGVSHRKMHPYAKANPRRPSFYDTGMYVDNFKAWITS